MNERDRFREQISSGVLLGDGAYGTALTPHVHGGLVDALCLSDPRQVEELHLGYIRAGADLVQTNTYAANRVQLEPFGLGDQAYALNLQGAKVARRARETAGRGVLVAGSVGPLGVTRGGVVRLSRQEMHDAYEEQVAALLAGGVDLFLIETQSDPVEAAAALAVVRGNSDLPAILNFSFAEGDRTLSGYSVAQVVRRIKDEAVAPPDLFGVNCSLGPSHTLRILRRLRRAGMDGPFAVAPNAGPPMRVGGHIDYLGTPEKFAGLLPEMVSLGARLVGGCCGTDAAYVQSLHRARGELLGRVAPPAAGDAERRAVTLRPRPVQVQAPAAPATALALRLGREFLYGVELDPPKGSTVDKFLADAEVARAAGADFVNVGDSPMARVRMGALAAAHLVQRETGLETILHMTTRDRNLAALQADLLSAGALGLHHVLALTGDRPQEGGHGVFEADSVGLLRVIGGLNRGHDRGGDAIGQPTRILAGCACDPGAEDLDRELARLEQKLDAGAEYIMTQPLYAREPLLRLLDRLHGPPRVPILLGVMPLYSYRHALYLHNEVPGISIPPTVREAMRQAGERGVEVGRVLAEELLAELRPLVQGVYVVPSFGKMGPVAALLEGARRRQAAAGTARVSN